MHLNQRNSAQNFILPEIQSAKFSCWIKRRNIKLFDALLFSWSKKLAVISRLVFIFPDWRPGWSTKISGAFWTARAHRINVIICGCCINKVGVLLSINFRYLIYLFIEVYFQFEIPLPRLHALKKDLKFTSNAKKKNATRCACFVLFFFLIFVAQFEQCYGWKFTGTCLGRKGDCIHN